MGAPAAPIAHTALTANLSSGRQAWQTTLGGPIVGISLSGACEHQPARERRVSPREAAGLGPANGSDDGSRSGICE